MTPERLQELLNAFVDDQLDAQGQRELAKALETDGEARRAFVRATDQHQSLRDLLGGRAAAAKPRRWNLWIVAGAAAAAALLALSLALLRPPTPPVQNVPVATHERKPAPTPPRPTLPDPAPVPVRIPEPQPEPKPTLPPLPPPPTPPKEPEKPPTPAPPEPKPVEPRPPDPKPPEPKPPPPPKVTVIAVATIESFRGDVFALSGADRRPADAGQVLGSGQGLATGAGRSTAVVVFADGTRVELKPNTTVSEITAAAGKRIVLAQGALVADVAKQPAGQPLVFSTRHSESSVLGTRLALSCAETTRLEVKEGQVRHTRTEDKRSVLVGAGQYSVAAKGVDLAAKKSTRGPMMAGAAIWGEDFQDPDEIEADWTLNRTGLTVTTRGQLDIDCTPGGEASLNLRSPYAAPLRISVGVEFTQRPKGILTALRLQSWKSQDLVHVDADEAFYYLRIGTQDVTVDVPRKGPRRERWTLELAADGNVLFSVDGKQMLKSRLTKPAEDYHLTLLTRAKDALPGTHVRFDNFLIERVK